MKYIKEYNTHIGTLYQLLLDITMVTLFLVFFVFIASTIVSGSTECDDFQYGALFSLTPASNILGVIAGLESETRMFECK